jgi:hypothetical protein
MRRILLLASFSLAHLSIASSAFATFHLWDIAEIYSNADGSVQFVEMVSPVGSLNEHLLMNHRFTATAANPDNILIFPNNLGSNQTSGRSFLIATPGFASLPGAVTPDYTFPTTNFFSTVADTLNFAQGTDTVSFTAGQLPTDGLMSINRNRVPAINSPKNFAGQVGSLSPPMTPGDVNSDGAVDRLDVAQMVANLGRTGATRAQGDLDGNGNVGLLDAINLQINLDVPSPSAASGVPEPATAGLVLVILAAAGLFRLYRRAALPQLHSRA